VSVEVLSDAIWAALAALTVAAVMIGHLPRTRLARVSTVVRWLESTRLGYLAVLLFWAWAGWHFFAR
jgi:Family of unknown function (DUF6186)